MAAILIYREYSQLSCNVRCFRKLSLKMIVPYNYRPVLMR